MVPGSTGVPYTISVNPASMRPGRVTSSGSTDIPAVVITRSVPPAIRSFTLSVIRRLSSGAIIWPMTVHDSFSTLLFTIGINRSLINPLKISVPVTRMPTFACLIGSTCKSGKPPANDSTARSNRCLEINNGIARDPAIGLSFPTTVYPCRDAHITSL